MEGRKWGKLEKREKLTALLEEHHAGKKDNSRKIWTVLAFLFWYQEYCDE